MPRWGLVKMVNIVLMNLILPSHYLLKGVINFPTGHTGTVAYISWSVPVYKWVEDLDTPSKRKLDYYRPVLLENTQIFLLL